jgi:predicted GIY-YIG superfamily endonuclease
MKYVYLLRSLADLDRRYIGISDDFRRRLAEHNSGNSPHTRRNRPWKPVVVLRFEDDAKAASFERYLKSGSGHTFAKRHLW